MRKVPRWILCSIVASALASASARAIARQVPVREPEGLVHGFLTLRSVDGTHLADGDLIQSARGQQVTVRLIFRFADGSLHDETSVFLQGKVFRLVSDHLIQRGPSFPQPIETRVDVPRGQVTVRYADDRGRQKVDVEHMTLPVDLVNGLLPIVLKDISPTALPKPLPMLVATPKPRLVKLALSTAGEEPFVTGRTERKAIHYVAKVQIGGIAGLVAPLVGKQPEDLHVWILKGDKAAFVKSEQPLYPGGPVWRIELVSPTWPRADAAPR